MSMLRTFLILLAFQTAATGPRSGAGEIPVTDDVFSNTCAIQDLAGQLVFPAFVAPVHFVNIELHPMDSYSATQETFTGPYESFHFYGIRSGDYDVIITMAGMDVVRQLLHLGRDNCTSSPGAHVIIPLHRSPAINPSPIAEDAVAIEALTRRSPDSYEANLKLGLDSKNENALTHALELNSGSMLARTALAERRFETGKYQEAAILLSEAVRLGSTSPDVYFMLGSSYYKLGDLALAEASLVRALDIDPGFGKAHLQLYNVYMKGQSPEKALAEAKTYLTEYPNAGDREYVQSVIEKKVPTVSLSPATSSELLLPAPVQVPQSVAPEPAYNVDPELDAVIRRATEYVTKYETELGNLIGTEEYLQTLFRLGTGQTPAITSTPGFGNVRTGPQPIVGVPNPLGTSPGMTRRTSSDFLLINVGPKWAALREVKTMNGLRVKNDQPPLESAFDDSPASNTKRFNSIKADSTKYNIGDVLREYNLPTFALQVLRRDEVSRFSFQREGSEKIAGNLLWRVSFRETKSPTLVVNAKDGRDLYSTGTLWIEPETGRILKTEFRVENRLADTAVSSDVIVTYAHEKARDILVPGTMVESYKTANEAIECRAEYSKFRLFTADVKFEFDMAPARPRP